MPKTRLKAVVRVTLDVEADGVWGSDTTWDQITKQAEDSVRDLLTNWSPLASREFPRRVRKLEMVQVAVVPESSAFAG